MWGGSWLVCVDGSTASVGVWNFMYSVGSFELILRIAFKRVPLLGEGGRGPILVCR